MNTSKRLLGIGAALIAGLAGCAGDESDTRSIVEACTIEGDPTCADVAAVMGMDLGDRSYVIDPAATGDYELGGGDVLHFTTTDGYYFDWSSTLSIDALIVKAGPYGRAYVFDPESSSGQWLFGEWNNELQIPYPLDHVTFCYDGGAAYALTVTKTATPSLARAYGWTIDKSSPVTALTLAPDQTYVTPYEVTVTRGAPVESGWAATGTITIANDTPLAATVTAITDVVDGGYAAAVTCPFELPATLAPAATVSCTYEVALPDGATRTNVATVATTGVVAGGTATAAVDFAAATVTTTGACAEVSDDLAGALGRACATTTYAYSLAIGPYEACGITDRVVNTASFVATDGATGAATWAVDVTLAACDAGCTLTPGYWKTHSAYGPAPADDTWLTLSAGPDTPFFLSGATWYDVLWTAPRGNAYYILAHAYEAAWLSGASGATTTAVTAELTRARALFEQYTPAQVAALPRRSATRAELLSLATALDRYVNGLTGPGHCDE